jgi:hypothetical protein
MSRELLIAENEFSLAKERYIKAKVMYEDVPEAEHKALQVAQEKLDKLKREENEREA